MSKPSNKTDATKQQELIKDVITNRRNIMRQINQNEQMTIGVKRIENMCCSFIKTLYQNNSKKLVDTLVEEVNQKFTNKSIVNSVEGTLIKIVGDVLEDEDTRETILKHLRGGCHVDLDVDESIRKKKKIMADLREKEFVQGLNKMVVGGGGPMDSPLKIDVDPPEKIQNTICSETFVNMFKSGLFTELKIKQIARDMVENTIRTHPTIKSTMSTIVSNVLKQTFDAKTMKNIFMEKLSGGCYKRKMPKFNASTIAPPAPAAPEQAAAPPMPMAPPPAPQPSDTIQMGGRSKTRRILLNKMRFMKFQKSKTRKRSKHPQQKGGYQIIQRLSFDTLINRAYPVIKSCLCDCVKDMYRTTTPKVFARYQEFCKIAMKSPYLIDHAQSIYGRTLDRYLHSPEKQIKIDIRDNILRKCPPIQDPEIKFSGNVPDGGQM
jgi:hypothetical protein